MSVSRPTKREQQEQARLERERIQQDRRRRDRHRKVWIAAGVAAGVVVMAAIVLTPSDTPGTVTRPSAVHDYEVASRDHVDGTVEYPQDPPVGGDHNGAWLNCAVYDQSVPSENAVHSLEHGAVWITYQPNLPQDQVETLRQLGDETYLIVSPYPGLAAPVVASSWGHQLQLRQAGDERLHQFIRAFRQGPDTPELGAPCTGGIAP